MGLLEGKNAVVLGVADESSIGWAAARASRKKRNRADSSPIYLSLMILSVTGHRRFTSKAL